MSDKRLHFNCYCPGDRWGWRPSPGPPKSERLWLPEPGAFSSHSQWGSQIWIEVACGHNDCSLLAPVPTHLLRLQNPLGSQTFSTSVSQKKHDLCWLDYKYLLQFTLFPITVPLVALALGLGDRPPSVSWSTYYLQRQGKQWPLYRTLPSHKLRSHKPCLLVWKSNRPGFWGCSAEKSNTGTYSLVVSALLESAAPPERMHHFIL